MCGVCGCAETKHEHRHGSDHARGEDARVIAVQESVFAKNRRHAERNRRAFEVRGILALNLVSSPGSGKTTLLERTIADLGHRLALYVIEGDQATERDADRIRAAGGRVVQINTGSVCHLDAHMVEHALEELAPPPDSVVLIENVGNLVCPAMFDLGEAARVLLWAVTEGEDKPLKYPHIFRSADVHVLTKTDLLPYVPFDVRRALEHARAVRPMATTLHVSALDSAGLDAWYAWLDREVSRRRPAASRAG